MNSRERMDSSQEYEEESSKTNGRRFVLCMNQRREWESTRERERKTKTKTKEKTKRTFRVIKAQFKEPRDTTRPANKGRVKRVENNIYFITNDFGLTPQEVAEAYRRRWDIEVFFRFLKQELNFSHFLSVSENGIKIILYMTLITAMLIMIYKRENGMGYDMAKFCFRTEMNDWVTALAVYFSGGDVESFTSRYHIRT